MAKEVTLEQRHGKERVRVARVWKHTDGRHSMVEWSVSITLLSDCLSAYVRDDNSDIVATDTMKNTVCITYALFIFASFFFTVLLFYRLFFSFLLVFFLTSFGVLVQVRRADPCAGARRARPPPRAGPEPAGAQETAAGGDGAGAGAGRAGSGASGARGPCRRGESAGRVR